MALESPTRSWEKEEREMREERGARPAATDLDLNQAVAKDEGDEDGNDYVYQQCKGRGGREGGETDGDDNKHEQPASMYMQTKLNRSSRSSGSPRQKASSSVETQESCFLHKDQTGPIKNGSSDSPRKTPSMRSRSVTPLKGSSPARSPLPGSVSPTGHQLPSPAKPNSPLPARRRSPTPSPPPARRRSPSPSPPPARRRSPSPSPPPARRRSPSPSPPPARRRSPFQSPSPPPARRRSPFQSPSPPPARRRSPFQSPSPPPARRRSPFQSPSPSPARRRSPSPSPPPARRRSPSPSPPPARRRSPSPSPPPARRRSPFPTKYMSGSLGRHRSISPRKYISPSPPLTRDIPPSPGKHRSPTPKRRPTTYRDVSPPPKRRRYSPQEVQRKHDRSRSPAGRHGVSPGYGIVYRGRSRSRSPMQDYYRKSPMARISPRGRYSPRRRSPPRYRRRSPRRRPWSPPPNRNTGIGKPGNNLFIAGFSFDTTERDLERKFSRFGRVTDVRIVRDKRSGDSRGFGFLTLERDEDADAAIRALDQTEWNGRIVLIEKAKTPTRY